jgi:hypothetical protein
MDRGMRRVDARSLEALKRNASEIVGSQQRATIAEELPSVARNPLASNSLSRGIREGSP